MLVLDKCGFNWIFSSNKHQSKVAIQKQNQYLDHLVDPSFQGVNNVFVLWFEDNVHCTSHQLYLLPNVEIKDYNVLIDG